jgi:hypothetical protein
LSGLLALSAHQNSRKKQQKRRLLRVDKMDKFEQWWFGIGRYVVIAAATGDITTERLEDFKRIAREVWREAQRDENSANYVKMEAVNRADCDELSTV